MKRKLIKFDIIHPPEYLAQKKGEWTDLSTISRKEYTDRLIRLRSNYSDFYTYHLNQTSDWEAEEFFLLDDTFLEKTAQELFGSNHRLIKQWHGRKNAKLRFNPTKWRDYVIDQYIQEVKPDVIFVRSQPMPSRFWQKYRHNTLLVSRLSARLPFNWHPNHWDMIYTDQPDFKTFFELHGVPTIINDQGFDARIITELKIREKKHEVTFVGGLGTQNFSKRTNFIDSIAQQVNFKWWGYWWKYGGDGRSMAEFSALHQTFHGLTSGLEMFQIYKDSKIVMNDYVDTANGIGFNQRMFEVMGCGAFLLTREAPNFKKLFPDNVFTTYSDERDFLDKVAYFLTHEQEREEIAQNAQKFVVEYYDYSKIVKEFNYDLTKALRENKPS
ncbi:glycosyltransferase [Tunicatimonas pelagia]|uniref:glycosyltransferase family protein n=1 Tax=Tunicatimonas pelagia TaxID=931531 RepID=UPI002664E5D3|nr:glycosyltransferase [Tunicatimonas pelagia]WKN45149.1 glycosyltransferase [Tunicatimonas pelagia]